ncbi:MAG: hypothetical protein Q8N74_03560 [Sulfuricella sp.]|nr:hypothetical protein [Sulfuricella sp.]
MKYPGSQRHTEWQAEEISMGNWISPAAGKGGKPVDEEGGEEKNEPLGNGHRVKRLPHIRSDV